MIEALPRPTARPVAAVAILLACGALMARTPSNRSLVALVLVGALGLLIRVPPEQVTTRRWVMTTGAGLAIFALGRSLGSPLGVKLNLVAVIALVLAGFAEEALFRRALFGLVETKAGTWAAVVISATLFALIHVPTYGLATLPLNIAAGMVLSWQRMAAGTWTASGVTHAVANLMQARWL